MGTVQTVAQAPFNPELSQVLLGTPDAWYVSTDTQSVMSFSPAFGIKDDPRTTLNVWRWNNPTNFRAGVQRHKLDGTVYVSRGAASRAAYEAGLVGQYVR